MYGLAEETIYQGDLVNWDDGFIHRTSKGSYVALNGGKFSEVIVITSLKDSTKIVFNIQNKD